MTLEAPCIKHSLVAVVLPVEPPAALELALLPHALVDHLAAYLQHPEAVPRGGNTNRQDLCLGDNICLLVHFGPEFGRWFNILMEIDSICLPVITRGKLVCLGSGCAWLFEQC